MIFPLFRDDGRKSAGKRAHRGSMYPETQACKDRQDYKALLYKKTFLRRTDKKPSNTELIDTFFCFVGEGFQQFHVCFEEVVGRRQDKSAVTAGSLETTSYLAPCFFR